MMRAEQRLDPAPLPASQRLAAKFRAAAQALGEYGARCGVEGAAEAGQRIAARLATLAGKAQGGAADPLDRLAAAWGLSRAAQLRLLVAALPAIDAEAAELIGLIEGDGGPLASIGTLEALFPTEADPLWAQRLACDDPFIATGLLALEPGGVGARRRLAPCDGLWPGLLGLPIWPEQASPMPIEAAPSPLSSNDETRLAVAALASGAPALIGVVDDSPGVALERAIMLCSAADRRFAVFGLEGRSDKAIAALLAHALLRGCCPVLLLPAAEPAPIRLAGPDLYPAPVIVAGRDLSALVAPTRALICPPAAPVNAAAQTQMWRALLPEAAPDALAAFAARHPFGPVSALSVLRDAQTRAQLAGRAPTADDLVRAAAVRGAAMSAASAERRPTSAEWDDLVLPEATIAELRAAVDRLRDRPAAAAMLPPRCAPPGQRLLFLGGPGAGKTLAAEVLATEIGAGFLVADTPRLLSKWLGETERNLAELFRAAEESHAVLFFDEADAVFGRRVETREARDRYANVETAYLLQRIERFSGVVILATNLPGNLDEAFRRRFDAIVDFPPPDAACRATLWRRHLPRALVEDGGLDLDLLAEWYALTGGLIRNAAVAAAYLAAAERRPMTAGHLFEAIAREYVKNGKPFPGLPGGPRGAETDEVLHA
ncbi:MAG: ATP-binding protein [Methylocystis sp.]|uniref:ATP-binding protein n=1 Tax=Methylocystis sp. TaxID=1911079 RepID=UPI003DA2D420